MTGTAVTDKVCITSDSINCLSDFEFYALSSKGNLSSFIDGTISLWNG